jgi:two-component system sensor histidine kinase GlrK
VEIRRIAARVIDDHKLALRTKTLKLDLDLPDIRFSADSEKLRVMLDNLVSNAIKFSPAHGTIRLSGAVRDEHVEIEVRDDGPGIAVEERTRVFEPFYRGRSASGALVKGTGIGLSVVREYARMHGGSVEIVGDAPGARFCLRLPRQPEMLAGADSARVAEAREVAR